MNTPFHKSLFKSHYKNGLKFTNLRFVGKSPSTKYIIVFSLHIKLNFNSTSLSTKHKGHFNSIFKSKLNDNFWVYNSSGVFWFMLVTKVFINTKEYLNPG